MAGPTNRQIAVAHVNREDIVLERLEVLAEAAIAEGFEDFAAGAYIEEYSDGGATIIYEVVIGAGHLRRSAGFTAEFFANEGDRAPQEVRRIVGGAAESMRSR